MLDSIAIFFIQIWVLTWEEIREMLFKTRALLTLAMYAGLLGLSLFMLVKVQNQIGFSGDVFAQVLAHGSEFDKALREFHLEGLKPFIEFLSQVPNSIWMFQFFSMLWFPVLITLMSYDMIALDANRGTLRFLVQRTSRTAYFLSKFFAHSVVYILLQLIAVSLLYLLLNRMVPDFNASKYIELLVRYFLVFVPFVLCLVSATEWVSCSTKKPTVSLIRLHLLWIYFIVIVAKYPQASPLNNNSLTGLIMPVHGHGATSVSILLVWTGLFLLLGLIPFQRRDL